MKKLLKVFTNKVLITVLSFFLQIAFIGVVIFFLSKLSIWIYAMLGVFSVLVVLYINGTDANPNFKLAWVIPILAFPLFGGVMYLLMGRPPKLKRKDAKLLEQIDATTDKLLNNAGLETNTSLSEDSEKLYNYIKLNSGFPLYDKTQTTFYELGEDFFEALAQSLQTAKKFIFLEFFIFEKGKFWDTILEILKQKVAEGLDVRVTYDDIGCLLRIPNNFLKTMNDFGIKTQVFNKIKPSFNIRLNNRTHRKIAVIDGNIAFTGGINIADEYININSPFGHWKDTAIKLEGDAAWSFTIMFLRFWQLTSKKEEDYEIFKPSLPAPVATGRVQPLSGGPGKNQQIIENSLIQMLNNSDKYCYMTTPYLILDNEFLTALIMAAKSGVDVRIMMPHIPDKKTVFMMSRSFYPQLLKAGVKIYEYLPGFMHSKYMICDSHSAYIGTCNLDYRSFYLHYECGVILYDTPSIDDMLNDYNKTLEKCKEITYQEATDVTIFTRLARSVLRLIAPLL